MGKRVSVLVSCEQGHFSVAGELFPWQWRWPAVLSITPLILRLGAGLKVAEDPRVNMILLHQELSITAEMMLPPASL